MQYLHNNSEQYLFDRNLGGLWMIGKLLLETFLYLPLLFTGYLLSDLLLNKEEAAVLWMTTTAIFAVAHFFFIYFLKGMIVALLKAKNFLWIPIFLICIGYTGFAPGWMVLRLIDKSILQLNPTTGRIFTWMIVSATTLISYRRFSFLTDNAPTLALPLYFLGYWLVKKFT
ncbi:hypothetical protein [Longitalea luteola]|uniref:hypothetical protein n=1 Tax=Longitalea luteola TaxID=2812563 RepID=UPI001A959C74|nr:hypothetical protein [Longitalea luteola]